MENVKKIPKDLAVYIFKGSEDGANATANAKALAKQYKDAGIKDVTVKIYLAGDMNYSTSLTRKPRSSI
jgi:alpha-beta hydrolase superfamily lysophospholipase